MICTCYHRKDCLGEIVETDMRDCEVHDPVDVDELLERDVFGSGVIMSDEFFGGQR